MTCCGPGPPTRPAEPRWSRHRRIGLQSTASQQTCNSGPSTSASLTVVIRSATLTSAMAGSYIGTLQITIAPE